MVFSVSYTLAAPCMPSPSERKGLCCKAKATNVSVPPRSLTPSHVHVLSLAFFSLSSIFPGFLLCWENLPRASPMSATFFFTTCDEL